MIVGDVLDQVAVNSAAKGSKHLYHFAGLADIGEAKENPVETIRVNGPPAKAGGLNYG